MILSNYVLQQIERFHTCRPLLKENVLLCLTFWGIIFWPLLLLGIREQMFTNSTSHAHPQGGPSWRRVAWISKKGGRTESSESFLFGLGMCTVYTVHLYIVCLCMRPGLGNNLVLFLFCLCSLNHLTQEETSAKHNRHTFKRGKAKKQPHCSLTHSLCVGLLIVRCSTDIEAITDERCQRVIFLRQHFLVCRHFLLGSSVLTTSNVSHLVYRQKDERKRRDVWWVDHRPASLWCSLSHH